MSTLDRTAPQDVQAVQRIVAACEHCRVYLDPSVLAIGTNPGAHLGTMSLGSDARGLFAVYVRPADDMNKRQAWHVTSARIERLDEEELAALAPRR